MNGIPTMVRTEPGMHQQWSMIADGIHAFSESEISEADSEDIVFDETLYDRFVALKDIVPPQYRSSVSSAASTGYSWATSTLSFSGKALWVLSTSALLLGVPWALAFSEEQQVQEMEREMRMQQSANEVRSFDMPS